MHSLLTWIIPCVVITIAVSSANADEKSDVKAIVDKAIKAVGGEDKLLRMFRWKERYYIGDSEAGTVRDAILQLPDHWWQDKTDIAKDNPDRLDKTQLVDAWTLAPLIDKDSKLAPLPEITVDEKLALGVRLSRHSKADLNLYFDKDSGLLVRIDWRTYHITFSDWKEVDGVNYPSKSFVRTKEGKLHLRTEFLELERLKSLPDGLK